MICPECLENSREYGEFDMEIEMDLVECFTDTYDFRGEHKQINLGMRWICPECDHEIEYHQDNTLTEEYDN